MAPARALLALLALLVLGAEAFRPTHARSRPRALRASGEFENPNPIAQKAIESAPSGFKEGRRIKFGVLSEPVDEAAIDRSAGAERARAALRAEAAASLTNIDDAERGRRTAVGYAAAVVTAGVAAAMIAAHAGPAPRLALFFPAALSFGYIESGRVGL